jgi:hypothetical protein
MQEGVTDDRFGWSPRVDEAVLMPLVVISGTAQTGILNPHDPIVIYDSAHPPTMPPFGTLAKWVKSNRVTWNTAAFKCYMYNGIAFRLKFPKSYSTAADGKNYPLYLFFHGMGEVGPVFDNESSLSRGGGCTCKCCRQRKIRWVFAACVPISAVSLGTLIAPGKSRGISRIC